MEARKQQWITDARYSVSNNPLLATPSQNSRWRLDVLQVTQEIDHEDSDNQSNPTHHTQPSLQHPVGDSNGDGQTEMEQHCGVPIQRTRICVSVQRMTSTHNIGVTHTLMVGQAQQQADSTIHAQGNKITPRHSPCHTWDTDTQTHIHTITPSTPHSITHGEGDCNTCIACLRMVSACSDNSL